ncbi:hypothetical protein C8Q79DRAFT_928489 [Trametes meyenii]|nr:hypothetical protein C8Q79DRAFT_928489 [Trametes meyenii]
MSTSMPFDDPTPFEPEPSESSTQRSLTRTSSVRSLFEGRLDGLTPSHGTATRPHTPGPSANSPTLLGDLSFDVASLGSSWATSTPTPGQRGSSSLSDIIAPAASDDLALALGPARGSTSNTSGANNPTNLDAYRQLAEGFGLPSNQADEAVKLATMTPTTARVYLYAQMQTGFSLMNRLLREQQNTTRRAESSWTMNKRTRERMHALVRIALLTPLPASWKLDLQRTIMRLLVNQGYLSKDLENYEDRTQHVLAATDSRPRLATYPAYPFPAYLTYGPRAVIAPIALGSTRVEFQLCDVSNGWVTTNSKTSSGRGGAGDTLHGRDVAPSTHAPRVETEGAAVRETSAGDTSHVSTAHTAPWPSEPRTQA